MYLKTLELAGFKSFAKKTALAFKTPITAIVGPNGSGKSNVAEAFRFALGEQRLTQMRGRRTEDLIWNGSPTVPRVSRASVKLTFDNTSRLFDVDFEEAVLERIVHRDASTEYKLNGSPVRLKDITDLLAGANIGTSGHHIISQGQADRVLSVNMRERKGIIEDALGLRVYQHKKEESMRKLERTQENIEKAEGLRREIKPHLRFLKKQVEKVERAREIRETLVEQYQEYFAAEEAYLQHEEERLVASRTPLLRSREEISAALEKAKHTLATLEGESGKSKDMRSLEETLSRIRHEKDEIARELGRVEGQREAFEKQQQEAQRQAQAAKQIVLSQQDLSAFAEAMEQYLTEGSQESDTTALKGFLTKIRQTLKTFLAKVQGGDTSAMPQRIHTDDSTALAAEHKRLSEALAKAQQTEQKTAAAYTELQKEIETDQSQSRESERAIFQHSAALADVESALKQVESEEVIRVRDEEMFKQELGEAGVRAGREALNYSGRAQTAGTSREEQLKRLKEIEKMKVRLEEAGGGSSEEIMNEYREVTDRDGFLEREVSDLEKSAQTLKELIDELEATLAKEFAVGLKKINVQFQEFFSAMFSGGTAGLLVVREKRGRALGSSEDTAIVEDENIVIDEGVEITVKLPHKKVSSLEMLSGGERALTSIALIFAMSQVNPPPFLILDETDAALDEANSRRYGDMIESLAKKSQLILITHNRETMGRAGVLYGVTMGADGTSQLLSVDFEEAIQVAK